MTQTFFCNVYCLSSKAKKGHEPFYFACFALFFAVKKGLEGLVTIPSNLAVHPGAGPLALFNLNKYVLVHNCNTNIIRKIDKWPSHSSFAVQIK